MIDSKLVLAFFILAWVLYAFNTSVMRFWPGSQETYRNRLFVQLVLAGIAIGAGQALSRWHPVAPATTLASIGCGLAVFIVTLVVWFRARRAFQS